MGNSTSPVPEPLQPKRPAHYLWAVLIARIYEVFPLVCAICGAQVRIIAFITHSAGMRQILNHISVESEPPPIAPARGPQLWTDCDAQQSEGTQIVPEWKRSHREACSRFLPTRALWKSIPLDVVAKLCV